MVTALVVLTLLLQVGEWWSVAAAHPVGTGIGAGLVTSGSFAAVLAHRRAARLAVGWHAGVVLLLGTAVVAAPWLTPPETWSTSWWPLTTATLLGCVLIIDGMAREWSFLVGCLPLVVATVGMFCTRPSDGGAPIGAVVTKPAHHFAMVAVCAAVLWAIAHVADLVDQADLPGAAERLAAAHVAALRRARPEAARQVHDHVLPVLQMVAMDRADVSARACRETASALHRRLDGDADEGAEADQRSGQGIGELVSAVVAAHAGALTVRVSGSSVVIVPRVIGAAMAAALAEALRNVARHADVRVAVVEISSPFPLSAGVRVRVIDEGRGFDVATVPDDRRGVTSSIRGRMRAVGGTATVRSGPGRGTVVTLSWRPPAAPRTGTAPPGLGVASVRWLLWPTAVHPLANLIAVVGAADGLRRPAWGLAGAAGIVVAVLALIWWIPWRRLSGAGTALFAVWMVASVAVAGAAVPTNASDPGLFGTGSSAAAVVAVVWAVRPRWQALAVGAALACTVLGVLATRFEWSSAWWVILAAPLIGAGAGAVMGALIRRAGEEVQAAEAMSGDRWAADNDSILRRFVTDLDPTAPALLDGLAAGSINSADDRVRRQAAATEQRLREGLTFAALPATRRAVNAARDRGIAVAVHLAAELDTDTDRTLAQLVATATESRPPVRLTVTARRRGSGWRLSVLGVDAHGGTDQQVLTVEPRHAPAAESVHQPTWQGPADSEGWAV